VINNNQTGPTSQKLFDAVTGMQYGTMPDSRGWVNTVTKL